MKVWPIAPVDGKWSLPDEAFVWLWDRMAESGRAWEVFYDGGIVDAGTFTRFLQDPRNLPLLVVSEKDEPVLLAWLNDIRDGSAKAHFCGIGPYRRGAGDVALQYWDTFRAGSEPRFRTLVGVTPETYKGALKLSRILGFRPIGTLPELCHLVYERRRVGGVVSYRLHPEVR